MFRFIKRILQFAVVVAVSVGVILLSCGAVLLFGVWGRSLWGQMVGGIAVAFGLCLFGLPGAVWVYIRLLQRWKSPDYQ